VLHIILAVLILLQIVSSNLLKAMLSVTILSQGSLHGSMLSLDYH
jgi:hypothetical protein